MMPPRYQRHALSVPGVRAFAIVRNNRPFALELIGQYGEREWIAVEQLRDYAEAIERCATLPDFRQAIEAFQRFTRGEQRT